MYTEHYQQSEFLPDQYRLWGLAASLAIDQVIAIDLISISHCLANANAVDRPTSQQYWRTENKLCDYKNQFVAPSNRRILNAIFYSQRLRCFCREAPPCRRDRPIIRHSTRDAPLLIRQALTLKRSVKMAV